MAVTKTNPRFNFQDDRHGSGRADCRYGKEVQRHRRGSRGGCRGGAGAAAPAAEVQTEFTVTMTEFGANKVGVIKVIREITAWV